MEPSEILAEIYSRIFFIDLEDAPEEHQALVAQQAAAIEVGTWTLEQAEARLVQEAKGTTGAIGAAYQFLTGEVPSEAGFEFLVSGELAGDFGKFNFENRFINQMNALIQGNPSAQATFAVYASPEMPGDADLIASITALYDAVTDITGAARDAAIDYLTRPEALEFYRGVAQERIMDGSNPGGLSLDQAAAIVALGSIVNIAVRDNVPGLGSDVHTLLTGLADGQDLLHPTEGTDISDLGGSPDGDVFTLTTGADNIVGTAGNDLITGIVEDDDEGPTGVNTFGPGDVINGGAGVDTLRLTQLDNDSNFGDGFGAGATVTGVEILEIRQAYSTWASFDLSGFSGLEQIVADMTYDTSYRFYNLQDELVSVTLNSSRADDTERDGSFYLYDINNSVWAGDDDTLTINVINAGSDENSSYFYFSHSNVAGDEVIENYNIVVAGDDNYLHIENDAGVNDAPVKTLTAANAFGNSGSLRLELDEQEDLVSVDASGMTGNFSFEFSGTNVGQEVSVVTGSGNDNIILSQGKFTVNLGAGDDRVELDAFGGDADDVNDTLDGGDGRDTIAMDADAIPTLLTLRPQNFEILAISGAATGAVTLDADDYGFDEVTLEVDVSQVLTLEDFNGGTLNIEASQTAGVIVESNTLADTLDIVIDSTGAVALASLDLTAVETVDFSSARAASDLTVTSLNVTGVKSLSFSGAGDVDINGITGAAATVNLSGLTGRFDNDGVALGATAAITIGNIGDNSIIELSATAGRNVLSFGAELDNDIRIDAFEYGAGITADVLDLSALGVTALSDLTFADTGADVAITSTLFDGSITLAGVANISDLTANNFAFA